MNTTLMEKILEWFKGQPFSNVMAFIQAGMIAGGIYLGVYVLIPSERQAILDGLQKQEDSQTKQIEMITSSFEKAVDRIDAYSRRQVSNGQD